jgi:hypothetical protein
MYRSVSFENCTREARIDLYTTSALIEVRRFPKKAPEPPM